MIQWMLATILATAPQQAPTHDIPLQAYMGKLRTVAVVIAGERHDFLFDTGGGFTSIDPSIVEAAGCRPHGENVGFRMSGEMVRSQKCGMVEMTIGGLPTRLEVDVFDLMALLPDDWPPVRGVISLQSFADQALVLDLGRNLLRVAPPSRFDQLADGMAPVPISIERELEGRGLNVYLEVTASIGRVLLLLDSGNLAGIRLSRPALAQFQTAPEAASTNRVSLDFAPGVNCPRTIETADLIHDGSVDARFLESATIVLDLQAARAAMRLGSPGRCGE